MPAAANLVVLKKIRMLINNDRAPVDGGTEKLPHDGYRCTAGIAVSITVRTIIAVGGVED
jgi:hypothetical protein